MQTSNRTIQCGLLAGLCLAWSAFGAGGDERALTNTPVDGTNAAAPVFISKEVTMIKEHKSGTWAPDLSDAEKETLFAIAQDTLAWCVRGSQGGFPIESYPLTPKLKIKTATFVTLKLRGNLRGCIGSLEPVEALYQSVHHNAINAAREDPRFSPVQPNELPLIEMDISLLSPIRDIASLDEFKPGRMGIIMAKGMRRAVYLPEVAAEQGWSKEETLSSLSQKAGLSPDAWKKDARFRVFESVVLSVDEKEK